MYQNVKQDTDQVRVQPARNPTLIIGDIVHKEIEMFITSLKNKLNAIDPSDLSDKEVSEVKEDVLSIVERYLG